MLEVSAIIPAHNEESTVGQVVQALRCTKEVKEVIVVDNASDDQTSEVAEKAGATVIRENRLGFGVALKVGMIAATKPLLFKCDADISAFQPEWIPSLMTPLSDPRINLSRGIFHSDYDEFPVTNLVMNNLLELVGHPLAGKRRILSGIYLLRKGALDVSKLPDDWAFDFAVIDNINSGPGGVADVEIGLLSDRLRPISHYVPMARDLMRFLLRDRLVDLHHS